MPCPSCNAEASRKRAERMSGLNGRMRSLDFPPSAPPEVKAAIDHLKTATNGFVCLSGAFGVGKTRLLCATINQALEDGRQAIYRESESLLQEMRNTFNNQTGNGFESLFQQLAGADVLCLDELGRETQSDWAQAQMTRLLSERYNTAEFGNRNGQKTLTVIATNQRPEEMSGQLVSRLRRKGVSHVFEMWKSPDLRPHV